MIDNFAALISVTILITAMFFAKWLPLVGSIIVIAIVFIVIWKAMEE